MQHAGTITRSVSDRVVAGVIGGIAHRYGWNPTLLRVLYVVGSALSAAFTGILVYLVLWVLLPDGE